MKSRRNILRIDEEKCNGCGLCTTACAEQAIAIVDGKARLVSDVYCDGLGACLGHCPQGAITIEERDADAFDEEKVKQHMAKPHPPAPTPAVAPSCPSASPRAGGCPGSRLRTFTPPPAKDAPAAHAAATPSALAHWPIQLRLVPPSAPFLRGADLLLAGDCVPFAYADFHQRLLAGHALLIGCPKLDDAASYVDKLAQILQAADLKSISVAIMEVPCCSGLLRIAEMAMQRAGITVPLRTVTVGLDGTVLDDSGAPQR